MMADNHPKPAPISRIAHFYLHAGYAHTLTADTERLMMLVNPVYFSVCGQIRRMATQKIIGHCLGMFLIRQNTTNKLRRNPSKPFQAACRRGQRTKMRTAQHGLWHGRRLITHPFCCFTIQRYITALNTDITRWQIIIR